MNFLVDVTLDKGDTTTFDCHEDTPLDISSIIWIKDHAYIAYNQTVSSDELSRTISVNGSLLIVSNISSIDEGTYTCFDGGRKINAWSLSLIKCN